MNRIVIQQTLHGYSEGHRLLSGSIKLNDEVARLLLRMSDLSGSNVVAGFDEYLTGYPLEEVSLYALAKTWYASDMPRPGSVWTHTLFIPSSAMMDIPDLQVLTSLFARPQLSMLTEPTKAFSAYEIPIDFEVNTVESCSFALDDISTIQIADLIETLYVQGKDSVLIGSASSRSFEAALFRVWSQQWPQLRNSFSFCTGALSSREFGGKPFDVQCAPNLFVREIISATAAQQSKEMTLLIKSNQAQPALFVRDVEDAAKPSGDTFRQLLWDFADAPNRKQYLQFALLIEQFLNLSERSADDIITMVAEQFPSKDTGYGLKSAFFANGGKVAGFKPLEEGEILTALASTSHPDAFDSEALLLKSRGRDLCNNDPQSARRTLVQLFRSPVNPLGEDILAGMIEAINPTIARDVTVEQPQFLPTLFRAKPELGKSPELWAAAGDRKRELVESLILSGDLADSLIAGIVKALLESKSEFLLRRALEAWKQPAVFGVLEWMSMGKGSLSEHSRGALTCHVESIARWVVAQKDCPHYVLVAAAHVIAPYTYQFLQFDTSVWVACFRNLVVQGNRREADYFAAMLLALGFQNAPPDSLALVEECFERIHQVAWDDAMPEDTWFILDPIVPHLWWRRDWDKCERLRRKLIEVFVKFHWPIIKLADCVKNKAFLSRVIESAKHVDGGREFVSQKFSQPFHSG
ncbi:MAG: hypothetical protein IT578_06445 [Verrucomicrobiae bacterium]|nr:hypothetical protein [Verrucomicrobiae bacterium]